MLIVSQDKETILNFNNIQNIRIEEYGTHVKGKKIYKIYSGNFEGYATLLGTYETRERAKEVLQEIVKCYEKTETYKVADEEGKFYIAENNIIFKYEMPEE